MASRGLEMSSATTTPTRFAPRCSIAGAGERASDTACHPDMRSGATASRGSERMPRTLEHAKEIVDKAIEFNVHPAWEDPSSVTDTLIQQRADEIVDLVVKTAAGGSTND